MKNDLNINDLILSSNFGLGKIVGFEKIGDDDQNFVVIESLEKKIKLMAPVVDNLNFRKLAPADVLLKLIEDLRTRDGKKNFDSKKERITYFKARSGMQALEDIFQTIAELMQIKDRGTVETRVYDSLVTSIKLEVRTVLNIEADEAAQIVDKSLVDK